ncbi:SpoIID/LytB domain-containing protein [Marinilabilia salmonicolor]|uniref:SpoIID/LytB domain-containing protein n=1 Tax=Marinilabilia salmonicolor TaxID=989 RepID=UPI00029A596A|nr:SpoIID/LytB domain-containing protein [Marinilabilia salmonicolor]
MQPNIEVGVLFAPEFSFLLDGDYKLKATGEVVEGKGEAFLEDGTITIMINGEAISSDLPVEFEPVNYEEASFELKDVVIGINFHWERKEDQRFKGTLRIISEDGHLTAVNRLPMEDYLVSVISSEMSATSSPQLLRAHAVISRSWLMAQKEKEQKLKETGTYETVIEREGEKIKWYDREDHINFDVCADDHCQRYQGITRASTKEVEASIADTFGEVLIYDNAICDARFSKACGGIAEVFENVWEPVNHPYLTKVIDNDFTPEGFKLDLKQEDAAQEWITGNPPAFCNTQNKEVLSQVLNDYDQETADFYRWRVTLSQEDVKRLLKKKIDLDLGDVMDLIPVERGESGRLIRLKIVGTKGELTIGKELEIRKALSESHLYSSAFVVEKEAGEGGLPKSFTLIGAGWGHGVGLCQIGAAVMGAKGYSYQEILTHYFRGAALEKRY